MLAVMRSRFGLAALAALICAAGPPRPQADDGPVFSEKHARRVARLSPLGPVPPDPTNRFADDPAAAHLGQYLFFDEGLSGNGEVSCATCHVPEQGFTDGKPLAEAIGKGTRHTPTLLNVAYHRWFFWDGRADSLWSQALGPIENPVEMGSSRAAVAHHLAADPALARAYERVFGALPDLAGVPADARPGPGAAGQAWETLTAARRDAIDRVFANVGKAIAAYERRLVRRESPFDRFAAALAKGDERGIAAYPAAAKRGLLLFVGRGNCTLCHNGANLTDGEFHNTSAPPLGGGALEDPGRYDGTKLLKADPFNAAGRFSDDPNGAQADRVRRLRRSSESWGEFKTPTLRNLSKRGPYMHQGQFATLADVVEFYSTLEGAAGRNHHQEQVLVPLRLNPDESSDLVAFLESLDGAPLDARLMKQPSTPLLGD